MHKPLSDFREQTEIYLINELYLLQTRFTLNFEEKCYTYYHLDLHETKFLGRLRPRARIDSSIIYSAFLINKKLQTQINPT